MPLEVFLYRCRNADGASKDWAYPVTRAATDAVLTVFYGRTGSILRQADTPPGACRERDPRAEALARAGEKVRKGYVFLGRYWLADNRRDLTPKASAPESAADPEPSPACLYWRWQPQACEPAVFMDALRRVAQQVSAVGWRLDDSPPLDHPERVWRRLSGDLQQGCLVLNEANAARIAFFILLARAKVGVRIADEAGEVVTAWPREVSMAVQTLEALGLKPRNLTRLLAASNGGDDWFFD